MKAAAAAGKQEPKATEMDLYAIIAKQGIRNTRDHSSAEDDLIKYLKEYGSPGVVRFAFQIRSRLSALIDDVWSWETVDDRVAMSTQTRPQLLRSAAAGGLRVRRSLAPSRRALLRGQLHGPALHLLRHLRLAARWAARGPTDT